ncbi:MAG: hypothetical protein WCP30_04065 [Mycobacteriaceae bacterium]
MNASSRMLVVIGAATALAAAGCAAPHTTTTSGPSVLPIVTSSTLPAPPPIPPAKSVGGIDAVIAGPDSPLLRPGGDPINVTVTLTNTRPVDIPDVHLVVSFGHCSCGYPGASIMPKGTMRMLDPASNVWVAAPYVVEGTGTDFLGQTLVPPFVLKGGQTITYQLEARLDANPDVTSGTSLLGVTIMTPDDRGHAAYLRVSVEP